MTFFQVNGNIMSESDRRRQNERLMESLIYADKPLDEHDVFTNKKLFSSLMCEYVYRKTLSQKERRDLLTELTYANTLGIISEEDVEFFKDEEGRIRIENITTVAKDASGVYKIIKKIPAIPFNPKPYVPPEEISPINKAWTNYIKWINKKEIDRQR